MNIENNLFSKEQIDKHNKTSIHAHNVFISKENEIEIDDINLMSIVKESKNQLQ